MFAIGTPISIAALNDEQREAHRSFMQDVWAVSRVTYARAESEFERVSQILESALACPAPEAWQHLYGHVSRIVAAFERKVLTRGEASTDELQSARRLGRFLRDNEDLSG